MIQQGFFCREEAEYARSQDKEENHAGAIQRKGVGRKPRYTSLFLTSDSFHHTVVPFPWEEG